MLIGWRVLADNPERKALQFVDQNGSEFSELIDSGQSIPKTFNGVTVDVWNGEHLMYDFLLGSGIGKHQYWGILFS